MDYIFASINDLASYFENQATLLRSHAKRKRSSRERESTLAAASTYENVAHIIRNTKIEPPPDEALRKIRAEAALIARNTLGLGTDED